MIISNIEVKEIHELVQLKKQHSTNNMGVLKNLRCVWDEANIILQGRMNLMQTEHSHSYWRKIHILTLAKWENLKLSLLCNLASFITNSPSHKQY